MLRASLRQVSGPGPGCVVRVLRSAAERAEGDRGSRGPIVSLRGRVLLPGRAGLESGSSFVPLTVGAALSDRSVIISLLNSNLRAHQCSSQSVHLSFYCANTIVDG